MTPRDVWDNKIQQLEEEIRLLNADLHQQRFNNKHNLSIDQKISDEIMNLKEENEKLKIDLKEIKRTLEGYKTRIRLIGE